MNEKWSDPAVIAAVILAVGGSVTTAVFKGGDLLREIHQRKINRLRVKLKKICPHYELRDDGGGIGPEPLHYREKGEYRRCHECNCRLYPPQVQHLWEYWSDASAERQEELMASGRKALKLRTRLELLGGWKEG